MTEYGEDVNDLTQQIHSLTERYNKLAAMSENQRKETVARNSRVSHLQEDIYSEIKMLKEKLQELDTALTDAKTKMKNTSSDFKEIVKKDSLLKLQRRVDSLKYEEFMTRKELDEI